MSILNADKLKIGYIILISTQKFAIEQLQQKSGFAASSKWTQKTKKQDVLYNCI